MTLRGYLKIFRQRWWIILACTALAAAVVFIVSPQKVSDQPPSSSYTATATLLVSTQPGEAGEPLGRVALYVSTGEVPRAAAERLGYEGDPAVLAQQVTVTPDSVAQALTISSTNADAQVAADRANAFADSAVAYFDQRGGATTVEVLQAATPIANAPTGGAVLPPNRWLRVLLGGLVGLLLGLALAIVLDHLDTRLRSRDEIHDAVGLPIVSEIPKLSRSERQSGIVVSQSPLSMYADGYRAARSALLHMPSKPLEFGGQAKRGRIAGQWGQNEEFGTGSESLARSAGKVIMITSALAGEGKTTSAANIAASFAETGQRVLVIDADLRSPSIHELFEVPQGAGVSDFLTQRGALELVGLVRPTSVEGVGIVTAGTQLQHPESLTSRMRPVIDAARELADVVIVDASPVLGASDALDILPLVDSVLLVVRSGRLTAGAAHRVAELLGRFHVPVAGVIVIGAPADTADGYGYGYGYGGAGYGYGYGEKGKRGKRRPLAVTEEPSRAAETPAQRPARRASRTE